MWCYGGYDDNGCQMADTCMPMKGGEYQEDIYYILIQFNYKALFDLAT